MTREVKVCVNKVWIEPLNDRVLIERLDEAQVGPIVVPDVAKDKSMKGVVQAVGPRVTSVKVGDLVLFNSKWNDVGKDYQNVDYRFDERMHFVQEADIFAKLD